MSNTCNNASKRDLSRNLTRLKSFHNDEGVLVLVGFWQDAPTIFVAITCLYCLLIIIGIVLNSLVCCVMIKTKRYLKNISCFFITHMAAVDLFYRVVFTPFVVYMSLPNKGVHSPIPCKTSAFVSSCCAAATFGSLVVIALDRYQNILHPLRSLKKEKRPFLIGAFVWFYALASSVMFLQTAHNVPLEDLPATKAIKRVGNPTSCNITPNSIGTLSVTISAFMTFFVPLGILIFAYTAIFVSLGRRCQPGLVRNASAAKSKAKVARMLVLVVIGFVLCFGPSIVVQMLRSYAVLKDKYSPSMTTLLLVTNTLELCSSLFNPLIYTFYSEDFRKDLLGICNLRTNRNKIHEVCNRKVYDPKALKKKPASTSTTTT